MSAKNIIVLGAGGFLGRHVCREFFRNNYTIYGIGHTPSDKTDIKEWGVSHWLESDISVESLHDLMGDERPEIIIHCAGGSSVASSFSKSYNDYQRTVVSTASALEFARQYTPKMPRFILASSAAVYGDHGGVNFDEKTPLSPISPYGYHKKAAEELCVEYNRFHGIPVSIIRLFSVYGEGLRKQLLWDAMGKFINGDAVFFGTGQEMRDWLHVDDAARLLFHASAKMMSGIEVYNGGNTISSIKELLNSLSVISGHTGVPAFTGEENRGNPQRMTADWSKARNSLGWIPRINLEEGIERYVKWYISETKT